MIRLWENRPLPQFVPGADPLLWAAIEANARAAGGGIRRDLWLALGEGDVPQGAVCRAGRMVWATVGTPEAGEETALFLERLGFSCAEVDPDVASRLSGERRDYVEMEYRGAPPPAQPLSAPAVMGVVDCNIAAGTLAPGRREEVYAELHLLVRRGAAQVFLTPEAAGPPAAASALSFVGSRCAVVGYLAALPQKRGRGYGTAALLAAVGAALELGRTPVLACEEALVPFYRERGFCPTGSIAALLRGGRNQGQQEGIRGV